MALSSFSSSSSRTAALVRTALWLVCEPLTDAQVRAYDHATATPAARLVMAARILRDQQEQAEYDRILQEREREAELEAELEASGYYQRWANETVAECSRWY